MLFGLITLTSLFFAKGIHQPFERVFEYIFQHVPGFWIHRAPWQKFGMIVNIGYAVLGGYGLFLFTRLIENKYKLKKYIATIFLIIVYLGYHHLFVFGTMFPTKDSNIGYHGHFNLGFHHTFPKYLYETKDYISTKHKEEFFNIFLLPELKSSVYRWGYGSSVDIVSIFLEKPSLYKVYGEGFFIDGFISNIYSDLVTILYQQTPIEFATIFRFL